MIPDRILDRSWWFRAIRTRITIDTRSLAVFRVVAGTLIVLDVLLRARNFRFYYTDDGVVPQALATQYTADHAVSVFFHTSSPRVIAALFAVHALVAVFLIVGYRTRLALVVSFLFVLSLDHHNPFATSYADILFRMVLFWALFLPLGERWSIDAVHRKRSPRRRVAGLASFAFLAQMVTMYTINGLHKTQSPLWRDGSATPLILGVDEIAFLAGPSLRQLPIWLLELGGVGWFYLLLSAPLLLVVRGRLRYLYACLFVGGHAVFALTVRIGAFPYVAIAGLVPFLQTAFYRDLARLADRFPPVEGVRAQWIRPIRARMIGGAERVPRPVAPAAASGRLPSLLATGILLGAVIGLLVVPWAGWAATAGVIPGDPAAAERVDGLFAPLGVEQPRWTVFAPHPLHTDSYYVFAARTTAGETVDVYNDRPLRYDRPAGSLHDQHGTYRERFYMYRFVRSDPEDGQVTALLEYYCDRWDTERDTDLLGITVWWVMEDIDLDSIDDPADRERTARRVARHSCTDRAAPVIEPPAFAE